MACYKRAKFFPFDVIGACVKAFDGMKSFEVTIDILL